MIDKVHYTGEFEHNPNVAIPPPPVNGDGAAPKKLNKADILSLIGARALIDDSLPNALLCASVAPVLLFGDYQWNKRPSTDSSAQDRMSESAFAHSSVFSTSIWVSSRLFRTRAMGGKRG